MAKRLLPLFLIFIFAFWYRFQRIHVPFWVDEFSSANQALLLIEEGVGVFNQNDHYLEPRNITTHLLIGLSFTLFGQNEWAARFPSMVVGSFVPVLIYLLSKKILPEKPLAAWSAAILSTTSYFFITWSRQARGYPLQQVLLLLSIYLYLDLFSVDRSRSKYVLIAFFITLVLGVLTHSTFILVIMAFLTHAAWTQSKKIPKRFFTSPNFLITFLILAVLSWLILISTVLGQQIKDNLLALLTDGLHNNIGYYHSFLWREYGLVSFLGVTGLIYVAKKKHFSMSLVLEITFVYLFFLCFLFDPVTSRYLLPIFPFLYLGMGVSLCLLLERLLVWRPTTNLFVIIGVLFTLLIVANGHKFDLKPNAFYSVDHDFREIALVDYDQVYGVIKAKGSLNEGKTAVIDTWPDRLEWYLGRAFQPNYVFRWEDAGPMKRTPFDLNEQGEKIVRQRPQTKLVASLEDFQKVLNNYPKGFIWIDDTTLPADVIEYAQKNLKKELSLDHFYLDDNPYSIWPGTLYSWGIHE